MQQHALGDYEMPLVGLIPPSPLGRAWGGSFGEGLPGLLFVVFLCCGELHDGEATLGTADVEPQHAVVAISIFLDVVVGVDARLTDAAATHEVAVDGVVGILVVEVLEGFLHVASLREVVNEHTRRCRTCTAEADGRGEQVA